MNYPATSRFSQIALASILSLTLGACGGEDSSSTDANSSNTTSSSTGLSAGNGPVVSRSGQVVSRSGQVYLQQGVNGALVCADAQGSGTCSPNAATATRTGADGSFQITFPADDAAAAQRFLAAPLIAEVADGTKSYTLSAPANKDNQINPLTTLVQGHIQRTGVSQGDAEHAVARQLGIQIDQIYKYQDQAATPADNARTAAMLTQKGLQFGAPLQIHAAGDASDTRGRLTSVNFKDAANFDFHLYSTDGTANGAGQLLWDPAYGGLITGNARTGANASPAYEYAMTTGYSGREEYLRTQGNPARVQAPLHNKLLQGPLAHMKTATMKDDAAMFEMHLQDEDISSQSMADLVKKVQSSEASSGFPIEHSLFTMDAQKLGTAVFPAGSVMHATLRTRLAAASPASPMPHVTAKAQQIEGNDLPSPAATLKDADQPLRLHLSINGTAWDAMKAALNIP